jgi:hypothetical protein
MMDIKYLKGSAFILNEFPHLKGAQVNSIFDKIAQLKDKSFSLKSSTNKKYYAINIEDGRKSVHPNGDIPYCQTGETHNCVTWRGDLTAGAFFTPGPNKDVGKIEHINWDEKTRGPALWVWLAIGFLLWQALS